MGCKPILARKQASSMPPCRGEGGWTHPTHRVTHAITNSLVSITSGHEAWLSDMHVPAYLVDSETRLAQQAQLERGWTSRPANTPESARRNFELVRSRTRGRSLLLHCGLLGRAGAGAGAGTGTGTGTGTGAGAQSPTSRGNGIGGGEGRARWLACRALLKAEELAHQQMAAAYLQAHTPDLYALAHSLPRPRAIRHPRSPRTCPCVHIRPAWRHNVLGPALAHIRRTCGGGLRFAAPPLSRRQYGVAGCGARHFSSDTRRRR